MARIGLRWGGLLALLLLGAVMVACSGGDDGGSENPGGDSTAKSPRGDTWDGKISTGTLTLSATLFVPATDPALEKYEELRKAAGVSDVVYGKVVAKNTGSAAETARFLTLTNRDGKPLEEDAVILDFACAKAARWSQTRDLPTDAIQAYAGLYNIDCRGAALAGPAINPGETFTYFVLVEAAAPPAFARVFVGASDELKK